jgi:hypothetical protein
MQGFQLTPSSGQIILNPVVIFKSLFMGPGKGISCNGSHVEKDWSLFWSDWPR